MTGEMSKEEVTKENYPLHFAAAKRYGGRVQPFDQYQGPYVYIDGRGRFWLSEGNSDGLYCWYSDFTEKKSPLFYGHSRSTAASTIAFRQTFADEVVTHPVTRREIAAVIDISPIM